MTKAKLKTQKTQASPKDFLNTVQDEKKRKDSFVLLEMMKKASGEEPRMWGASLIGFGNKRYKSPTSGREVDWFKLGFSPRKTNLTLYFIDMKLYAEALKKLGKHKTGGGCLYINNLGDVDMKVLQEMINVAAKTK